MGNPTRNFDLGGRGRKRLAFLPIFKGFHKSHHGISNTFFCGANEPLFLFTYLGRGKKESCGSCMRALETVSYKKYSDVLTCMRALETVSYKKYSDESIQLQDRNFPIVL